MKVCFRERSLKDESMLRKKRVSKMKACFREKSFKDEVML